MRRRVSIDKADDDVLVRSCQRELPHGTRAYELLVRRYEPSVYRVCLRILGNHADAQDAAQETFLRVFRGLAAFAHNSNFRTWLFVIARNECFSLARKRPQASSIAFDDLDDVMYTQAPEQAQLILPAIEDGELLDKTLRRLKVAEREIIALRFVAGLSIDEVAESLGLSLSAAKMRLYRAIERFTDNARRLSGEGNAGAFVKPDIE